MSAVVAADILHPGNFFLLATAKQNVCDLATLFFWMLPSLLRGVARGIIKRILEKNLFLKENFFNYY